jgi:hypothetical protein
MHLPRLIFILILTIVATPAKSSGSGFARLLPGDMLQVRFASEGCFHACSYELKFTRTNRPTVTITSVEWDTTANADRDGARLGTLPLSGRDLAGLDALMAFYRTNTITGCTTKNSIKVSQIHDGKALATEKLTDASCNIEDGRVKGVLSIESLIQRVVKEKDKK